MIRKSLQLLLIGLFSIFSFAAYAQSVNALFHHPSDPVAGNPRGPVTVVEFFDYQCSHCKNMAPTVSAIIEKNPNVRVVFKDLPILPGPVSKYAARAALAARLQGKYYPFSHALLTASEPLTEQSVMEIAKSTGLNVAKLKKDMDSPAVTRQLDVTRRLAEELQISGTPAFFIGRTDAKSSDEVNLVMGEVSQGEMQGLIDKAR